MELRNQAENSTVVESLIYGQALTEKTIRNNAKFAQKVDAIAAEYGPEAKEDILEGRKDVSNYPLRKSDPPETPVAEEDAVSESESVE